MSLLKKVLCVCGTGEGLACSAFRSVLCSVGGMLFLFLYESLRALNSQSRSPRHGPCQIRIIAHADMLLLRYDHQVCTHLKRHSF